MKFDVATFDGILYSVMQTADTSYTFEDCKAIFHYFFNCYEVFKKQVHPPIRRQQIQRIVEQFPYLEGETGTAIDLDPDDYCHLIRLYFATKFFACDYRINHFMSGNVRLMRWYQMQAGYDLKEDLWP